MLITEAMKMETEVQAGIAGTVKAIPRGQGRPGQPGRDPDRDCGLTATERLKSLGGRQYSPFFIGIGCRVGRLFALPGAPGARRPLPPLPNGASAPQA